MSFKDKFGNELQVGDKVLRAYAYGSSSAYLETRTVERIEDGKLYLDGSKGSNIRNFSSLFKLGGEYK